MLFFGALDQRGRYRWLGGPGPVRRTVPGQHANSARGFAGVAHPAAVKDHSVTQVGPLAALDELADGVLDLDRIGFGGPAPPSRQPQEVGVDGDSGDAERV